MTDRVHSLTVTLEKELRTDDAEALINAIKAMRFVADVSPQISDPALYFAVMNAQREVREKILKALYEITS